MPPTLAAVAALPRLGLRALTDGTPMDAPVRWVAVSELEDPTPFLEGGELVLTTGMRLDAADAETYVTRLVRREVTGLGMGVGLGHERVPPQLITAAAGHGLPLLEVPRATPFIAIGKAVSRMLAAEQYEDVTRAFQAQRQLTRAALKGPRTLIARLARELGGWALLLGPAGDVRQAAPAIARSRAAELAEELDRLRGGGTSASLSGQDSHIVLHGIGLAGRPRGFLAVGTAEPLPHVAHTIVGAAVSLLTLQSETPRAGRDLRAGLASLLLGAPPTAGVPGLPEPPVRVLACAGGRVVLDMLESGPAAERCLAVVPARSETCVVIVPAGLADQVTALARASGPVGVSEPAGPDGLQDALRQAEQALAAARRVRGHGVLAYGGLPGQGLLGLLDPDAAQGFAEALLAPLRGEDPELIGSLRAYLAANGQGEAAARALGVHRHTLRHRMRKAADLLGRDLDDPAVRAELWVALAVHPG